MECKINPVISIIMVAYNRKKFLIKAIESVLIQNIPRESYEIILVKNFFDTEIDAFLLRNNVITVMFEDEPWGESLYKGISRATGNIIAFLDDDDEFTQGKLKRILDIFCSEGSVVYYHNSFILISEDGELLRSPFNARNKIACMVSKGDTRNILRVLRQGLFSNLSSVAVSNDFISHYIQKIKSLTSAMDVFLFYMALESGKFLFFDNSALTEYFIRKQSAMHSIGDLDFFIQSTRRESRNEFRTYQLISNCLCDSNLLRISTGIGLQWKIFLDTFDENFNFNRYFDSYILFLKNAIFIRPRFTILVSFVFFIRIIFGEKAKLIIYFLRTKFLLV